MPYRWQPESPHRARNWGIGRWIGPDIAPSWCEQSHIVTTMVQCSIVCLNFHGATHQMIEFICPITANSIPQLAGRSFNLLLYNE
jgi:hypothetical protein